MLDAAFAAASLDRCSISQIDFANERVHLFCDVAPGEELITVKRTSLAEATRRDYQRFMRNKPGRPLVGILNDCILRRLNDEQAPVDMGPVFDGVPVARLDLRRDPGAQPQPDANRCVLLPYRWPKRISRRVHQQVIAYHSEFKAFFLHRHIKKLTGLSQVVVKQIEHFKRQDYRSAVDANGLADLGGVLSQADRERQNLSERLNQCATELHGSMDDLTLNINQQRPRAGAVEPAHPVSDSDHSADFQTDQSAGAERLQSKRRAPATWVAVSPWSPTRFAKWLKSWARTPRRSAPISAAWPMRFVP